METKSSLIISLDQIEVSSTNRIFRRSHEITNEALQELANSVTEHGVVQPVLVRPHPEIKDKYQLIFGERRYRASKLAGKSDIPAIIKEADDDSALEIQVIENLQRENVHPINEAKGYKIMLEKNENLTTADLAARFGKSETYILQRLKLNDLVRELKKDFLEDRMLLGHAIMLGRLTPHDQREASKQIIRRKGSYGTITELQEFIERNIMNSLSAAPFDKKDETLYKKAGACLNCTKRSGASPMLFAEIKEKDKCFDRACFFTKCHKFLVNRTKEIIETQPDIAFLADHSDPIAEVTVMLTQQNIQPLSEYQDFSQHSTGGSKVKGLWISGNKAGHMATVFLRKEEKAIPKDGKENAQVQVEKIKHRIVRGKELDREKVYAKIIEALQKHPSQKKGFNKKLMPNEEVLLWFIVYDKAGYHIKDELRKYIGVTNENPEKIYQQLRKLKPEDKAFLLRKVMLDQYGGNFPESNFGHIIYKIAADYRDIDIAAFENEQHEIRDKREARAKSRIKELQNSKNNK
jgi:ParB/RepB/Spo0J family partition protein